MIRSGSIFILGWTLIWLILVCIVVIESGLFADLLVVRRPWDFGLILFVWIFLACLRHNDLLLFDIENGRVVTQILKPWVVGVNKLLNLVGRLVWKWVWLRLIGVSLQIWGIRLLLLLRGIIFRRWKFFGNLLLSSTIQSPLVVLAWTWILAWWMCFHWEIWDWVRNPMSVTRKIVLSCLYLIK